jgi:hypothetical protein
VVSSVVEERSEVCVDEVVLHLAQLKLGHAWKHTDSSTVNGCTDTMPASVHSPLFTAPIGSNTAAMQSMRVVHTHV